MILNQSDAVQTPQQPPQHTINIFPDSQLLTTSNAMTVQQSFSHQPGICASMINQVKFFIIRECFSFKFQLKFSGKNYI